MSKDRRRARFRSKSYNFGKKPKSDRTGAGGSAYQVNLETVTRAFLDRPGKKFTREEARKLGVPKEFLGEAVRRGNLKSRNLPIRGVEYTLALPAPVEESALICAFVNGQQVAAVRAAEERVEKMDTPDTQKKNGAQNGAVHVQIAPTIPTVGEFTKKLHEHYPEGLIIANKIKPADVGLQYATQVYGYLDKCPAIERDVSLRKVAYRWKTDQSAPEVHEAPVGIRGREHRMAALYRATGGQRVVVNNLSEDQLQTVGLRRTTLYNLLDRHAKRGRYVRRVEGSFPLAYDWLPEFATVIGTVPEPAAEESPEQVSQNGEAGLQELAREREAITKQVGVLIARRKEIELAIATLTEQRVSAILAGIKDETDEILAKVIAGLQTKNA